MINKINNKKLAIIFAALSLQFSGCSENQNETTTVSKSNKPATDDVVLTQIANVDQILSQVHQCNESIVIRSQALTPEQIAAACSMLIAQEKLFHQTFNTKGKPVVGDNNQTMRANVYSHRDEFVKYATAHFNMPTNNGGMYLEGYPDKPDNQAEFVAYQRDGQIWNLKHEYVHYLDGRFNKYGDYCNGLHDDHAGPEFCPSPNLAYPHIVWWAEGVAEYIAHGTSNRKVVKIGKQNDFSLSELFDTSSNSNTGGDRVYRWGYLAVRFMMENHRDDIEEMLILIRQGNWSGYQQLITSWGTQFDSEFAAWLQGLK